MTGCVAAVAGAAAAGYYVGKDERTAGEIADDVTIGTSLKTLLIRDCLLYTSPSPRDRG